MISVDEARARVLAAIGAPRVRERPILDALNLALAEPVVAGLDLPPFTNSAMDGFAVRSADLRTASETQPVRLAVIGRLLAGETGALASASNSAVRIMTGAPLPDTCDAVIPFEEIEQSGADEIVARQPVMPGQNVRPRGEDVRAGDRLMLPGEPLTSARIGLLAALGIERVAVHPPPRVAILSTGDELAAGPLSPGRIHDSNGPMLAALVRQAGGEVTGISRVGDDLPALRTWLAGIGEVDLIISSGGISAGDSDYIRDLLLGELRLDFWKVAIKPGKPLALGNHGATPWIALPGNPVAAAVAFWQFARPALRKLGGHRAIDLPEVAVTILEPVENRGGRRAFIRAHVELTEAGYTARPVGKPGSAMLSGLIQANALLIVPESVVSATPGTRLTAQLLDPLGVTPAT